MSSTPRATVIALVLVSCACLAMGCGTNSSGQPAAFPPDYAATYQQVRACRMSIEHGFVRIRVLASPEALTPYNGRTAPFPTGAIVLKEERNSDDTTCTGPIINFTVMQKLDVGTDPTMLDWTWQEADASEHLRSGDVKRCSQCHKDCMPPGGYDHTCTVP